VQLRVDLLGSETNSVSVWFQAVCSDFYRFGSCDVSKVEDTLRPKFRVEESDVAG
jgi:hypothetical protein